MCALCGENLNVRHYTQSFRLNFFHTCHADRHCWLVPFYTISVTLTLAEGHKVSSNVTPLLHFLAHFSNDQDEIGYGVETISVEYPDTTWVRLNEVREITAVLQTMWFFFFFFFFLSRLAVYKLIWFKLVLVIDAIEMNAFWYLS